MWLRGLSSHLSVRSRTSLLVRSLVHFIALKENLLHPPLHKLLYFLDQWPKSAKRLKGKSRSNTLLARFNKKNRRVNPDAASSTSSVDPVKERHVNAIFVGERESCRLGWTPGDPRADPSGAL